MPPAPLENGTQAAFREQQERFAVFLKYSDQKDVQRTATLEGLRDKSPDVWRRVQDKDYAFTAYYMGVGNGGLEIPLTQDFIVSRGSKQGITLVCEDPSPQMQEGFYAAAQKVGIDDLVMEYAPTTFEDPAYQPPDADFSLSSHAWYYVPDWKDAPREQNTLVKFANTIHAKKGVGLITVYSNTSDRYHLRANFLKETPNQLEPSGEEIVAELERLGIKHEAEVIEAHTDISSCFQNGSFNPTDEGKLLLSFLLRASWNNQPDNIKQQVANDLTRMLQQNGKPEMNFKDLYIWIQG